MNFKQFLRLTILSTLVAWGLWVFLLLKVDPLFADLFERSLFYLTLFTAVVGTLLGIAVAIRQHVRPETILFRHVVTSFRQAVLLGILFVGSLELLSKTLFTWWTMLIFIFLLALIEGYAQSSHSKRDGLEHKKGSG